MAKHWPRAKGKERTKKEREIKEEMVKKRNKRCIRKERDKGRERGAFKISDTCHSLNGLA